MPDDDRMAGRQGLGPRRPYPHARPGYRRRPATAPWGRLPYGWQPRIAAYLMPASVILAGVLLVVAFGFIVNRAVRDDDSATAIPLPQPPALGDVPLTPTDQNVIPLPSPSPSQSASTVASASGKPASTPPAKKTKPPADNVVDIDRQGVPSLVDLAAEGRRDWVHWGQDGTFSLERAADGDFQILEGAPRAPRFKHALSPQRFSWRGGSPVQNSDGTTTGIRTCDKGNGFTISAPAAKSSRVLRLYVGAFAARGRLEATLSTGGGTEVGKLEQRDNSLATAVFVITYRAPKDGTLKLNWETERTFGDEECRGVALEAATLR